MIVNFTPWSALLGGVLIGVSAALLLWTHGRIAGISGIWGGILRPVAGDLGWRVAFVGGLAAGALTLALTMPQVFAVAEYRSLPAVALAGLLVGVGTRIGNGCTSGHGVCGLARFSPRSAASVASFMAVGMFVGTLVGFVFGGP